MNIFLRLVKKKPSKVADFENQVKSEEPQAVQAVHDSLSQGHVTRTQTNMMRQDADSPAEWHVAQKHLRQHRKALDRLGQVGLRRTTLKQH